MTAAKKVLPSAFLSYAHLDVAVVQKVETFCGVLDSRIRSLAYADFAIHYDKGFIKPGQDWQKSIQDHLERSMLLLPIVSPALFRSSYCRYEVDAFRGLEQRRGVEELIIPLYYETAPQLEANGDAKDPWADDTLVAILRQRQRIDIRSLQEISTDGQQFHALVDDCAGKIAEAMRRLLDRGVLVQRGVEQVRSARIVDASVDGAAASISLALAEAQPGDRILVRPGIYRESIILDKPVELVGDGDAVDIVIQGEGSDTVTCTASAGRIANLTILQLGSSDSQAHGLVVRAGAPVIEHCVISSQSLSCVCLVGQSKPVIRHNRIVRGASFGIAASGETRALIEDNEIAECKNVLVTIGEQAKPTLRRNTIREGMNFGVAIDGHAAPLLEDNEISHNDNCGVLISGASTPTLRANRVHSNRNFGVSVEPGTAPLLQGNEVAANANCGVFIRQDSRATLRSNRIRDNRNFGVSITGPSRTLLEDNELERNLNAEILIDGGANPTIRGNRVSDASNYAICVAGDSTGLIEGNEIRGSLTAAIALREGAAPIVRANRLMDGKTFGIAVSEGAAGLIEDNEVTGSGSAGIFIITGANPVLRRNRIRDGAACGVMAFEKGQGRFEDNDIGGNAKSGVLLDLTATTAFDGNRINGNGGFGIEVSGGKGLAVIGHNSLDGNAAGEQSPADTLAPAIPQAS